MAHGVVHAVATERLSYGLVVEANIRWSQIAFLAEDDRAVLDAVRAQVGADVLSVRYADVLHLVEPWMLRFDCASIPGVDRAIPPWTPALAEAQAAEVDARATMNAVWSRLAQYVSGLEGADPVGFAQALHTSLEPANRNATTLAWVRTWSADPGFASQFAAARAAVLSAQEADDAYRRAVRRAAIDAPTLRP